MRSLAALALLSLASLGCPSETPAPSAHTSVSARSAGATSTVTAAIDPAKEAHALYQSRCATCHGRDGRGDGPASGMLNPKPRSFADATWQAGITDQAIDDIVLRGGAAVGKSPLMPPNPDLEGKRDVVVALRALVRKYAR